LQVGDASPIEDGREGVAFFLRSSLKRIVQDEHAAVGILRRLGVPCAHRLDQNLGSRRRTVGALPRLGIGLVAASGDQQPTEQGETTGEQRGLSTDVANHGNSFSCFDLPARPGNSRGGIIPESVDAVKPNRSENAPPRAPTPWSAATVRRRIGQPPGGRPAVFDRRAAR